jgi:hypothetical protein
MEVGVRDGQLLAKHGDFWSHTTRCLARKPGNPSPVLTASSAPMRSC